MQLVKISVLEPKPDNNDHVGLKLDYTVQPDTRESRYKVECFFLVPPSLSTIKNLLTPEDFHDSVEDYLQFKTPDVSLRSLADKRSSRSPMTNIERSANRLLERPTDNERLVRELNYQLRLMGCIVRSRLLEFVLPMEGHLARLKAGPESEKASRRVGRACVAFLADLERALARWCALRTLFDAKKMPEEMRATYHHTNEFVSNKVEMVLTQFLHALDRSAPLAAMEESMVSGTERLSPGHRALLDARNRMRSMVLAEQCHRDAVGYNDVHTDEGLHRLIALKKFVLSALWLDAHRAREGRMAHNLTAALAAGAAMFVALELTIVHSNWFMINTTGFVGAATLTYMLKDRIKDFLKSVFSRGINRFLSDYRVSIRDPITDMEVGWSRETFQFIDALPKKVQALRAQEASSDELRTAPVVLHYEKDVHLCGRVVADLSERDGGEVHEILRFGLAPFLKGCDRAAKMVSRYDAVRDCVDVRLLRRQHHLDMLLVIQDPSVNNAEPVCKSLKAVVDQEGLQRFEEVATDVLQMPMPDPHLTSALWPKFSREELESGDDEPTLPSRPRGLATGPVGASLKNADVNWAKATQMGIETTPSGVMRTVDLIDGLQPAIPGDGGAAPVFVAAEASEATSPQAPANTVVRAIDATDINSALAELDNEDVLNTEKYDTRVLVGRIKKQRSRERLLILAMAAGFLAFLVIPIMTT